MFRKAFFVIFVAAGFFVHAEPSVYGGAYASGTGASGSADIYSLKQQIAHMQEEIDGLRSMVESLSERFNALKAGAGNGGGVSLKNELTLLRERVARLERKSGGATGVKSSPASAPASGAAGATSLQKAPSSKLFSRGVRLIHEKKYSEAKKRFDILAKRNYKPASSHFYLGEIAYHSGRYSDAIKHYQSSAEKNENAAYMDSLLLHTAIALEKIGSRKQARQFFEAIVDGYPGTSSAKEAKKHLK